MKNKLKIAVWHNLPSGGGKRQLYTHVKVLLERGHYIESWCPDTADQSFLPLKDLVPEHIIPLKFPKKINGLSIYNTIKNYNTIKVLTEALDAHNTECAWQIHKGDFDVLFANACRFFRTTSIGKYVQIPSALYFGEPYREFYEAIPELPWLSQSKNDFQNSDVRIRGVRLQAYNEREYAKAFNILLSNSFYSRETIMRVYSLESEVCYLGIDTDFFKPTEQQKEDFVVGLGSISHAKGIDRAIRALGTIPQNIRPNFIWIGNVVCKNTLNTYLSLAQKLDVNFSTRVNISDDEVKSLLSRASLMLYTSRLEPFGLAPLEANACGTPVVGIAEAGPRETIVDGVNGYLVNDYNPKSIGEKIIEILTDKAKLKELSEKSREHILSRWNLELCASNIERFLFMLKDKKIGFSTIDSKASNHLEELSADPKKFIEEKMGNPQIPLNHKPLQYIFIRKLADKHWKWWLNKLLPPIFMDLYSAIQDKRKSLINFFFKL